jgi:hypothetical protein
LDREVDLLSCVLRFAACVFVVHVRAQLQLRSWDQLHILKRYIFSSVLTSIGEFDGSARLWSSVGSALATPRRKERDARVKSFMVV